MRGASSAKTAQFKVTLRDALKKQMVKQLQKSMEDLLSQAIAQRVSDAAKKKFAMLKARKVDEFGRYENADGILEDQFMVYGVKCNPPAFPEALLETVPKLAPPELPKELIVLPPGCPKLKIAEVPKSKILTMPISQFPKPFFPTDPSQIPPPPKEAANMPPPPPLPPQGFVAPPAAYQGHDDSASETKHDSGELSLDALLSGQLGALDRNQKQRKTLADPKRNQYDLVHGDMLLSIINSHLRSDSGFSKKVSPALQGGKADIVLKVRSALNQGLDNCCFSHMHK